MQTEKALVPYAIVGSNGTVPDSFMLTGVCGALKGMGHIVNVVNRNEGEGDSEFFDRLMNVVALLVTPVPGQPPMTPVVTITCLYEQSTFDPPPEFPKGIFKRKGK